MRPIVAGLMVSAMLGGFSVAGARDVATLTVTISGRAVESLAERKDLAVKFCTFAARAFCALSKQL